MASLHEIDSQILFYVGPYVRITRPGKRTPGYFSRHSAFWTYCSCFNSSCGYCVRSALRTQTWMSLSHSEKSFPFAWKVDGVCDTVNVSKRITDVFFGKSPASWTASTTLTHATCVAQQTVIHWIQCIHRLMCSEVWTYLNHICCLFMNGEDTSLQEYLN